MKRTISKLILYTLLSCCLINFGCIEKHGTCYYLDASTGCDSQAGLSESSAWKTLENLAHVQLQPGDQILFKRGELFKGVLNLSGSGTPELPILIGAYGSGNEKPIIMAPDSSLYTVRIYNSDYVTVQDLEIVNRGTTDLAKRTGLKVESINYGVSHGIRLNELSIRDVNGSVVKKQGGGSGILIVNGGDNKVSIFDGLTIEYCHIKNCQRNAIIWDGYADRSNWHPNLNVRVRYNLIEKVPGDGIVPIGCDGAVIEYNVMRKGVEGLPLKTEAAAGIWPWACDNTIIRFNESSDHKAPWDAQGFDADYNCINTIIEYNYSHDNYGGMVLVCSSGEEDQTSYCVGNESPIVRYNISIGDGNRPYKARGKMFSPSIHIGGPVRGCSIYRNIIRNKIKATPDVDRSMVISDDWNGYADSTFIKENIFYAPELSRIDMTQSTNNFFEGNYYIGAYTKLPEDKGVKQLSASCRKLIEDTGTNGLMLLMDSVSIAGNEICKFVDKIKIEHLFNDLKNKK